MTSLPVEKGDFETESTVAEFFFYVLLIASGSSPLIVLFAAIKPETPQSADCVLLGFLAVYRDCCAPLCLF